MFAPKANQPVFLPAAAAKSDATGQCVCHSRALIVPPDEGFDAEKVTIELEAVGVEVVIHAGNERPVLDDIQLVVLATNNTNLAQVRVVGRAARAANVKMVFPSGSAVVATTRRELNC
ncbi:hypothetical protein A2763_01950 [Candidatus Kaiserbacteria bacterium RIFCSPHIGHO2_01_FULL_54_36]|uniref:Uncharacterized protein n=1 Tax=Candidatus Kaiserbacteria bacterium RIFCSPHIGHO2_01_FULL_54_36 TaxID=1798482 RepID=A0A1F6CKG6_9BACT|nr:MAG: hypothetical protein A2763_01950 [Candidatus Kaiserbacteria bacterium RIFCSPHIGHO2_01_FULL_54_36]OGG75305.1 MAG: hypothetical protein A3A41_01305 [Candidatus Kaiserbacteria bacterium RIFCSPLOWO2_01_FULL_54_22]